MNKKFLLVIAAMFLVATAADAATLEVGSGKTYSTIQDAVDAATPGQVSYGDRPNDTLGDTIVVYPGNYAGWIMPGGYDCMTVKASINPMDQTSASQRVTLNTRIHFPDGGEGSLIEGFYINNTVSTHAISEWSLSRLNTFKNIIIYGTPGVNAGFFGIRKWGQSTVLNCTIFDNGKGIQMGASSQTNLNNSIVAFNDDMNGSVSSGYSYGDYNCYYLNGTGNGYGTYDTPGANDLNVDPLFASTNPVDDDFLWLAETSPCDQAASDGGNMGALPTVPEPMTLALLGLAGSFVLRRRRS